MTPGGTGGEEVLDLFAAAGTEDGPEDLTVSELNRAVRGFIEGAFGGPVWVRGEIGNWKRAASGHCYFSLKDEACEVRCVMWRNQAARLPMDPDDGMEVRLHADPTLYEARGSYQLKVRALEAAGEEGLWRLAFERLRQQLQEEGLLAPERKRRIPRYPNTIGVVTSTAGAALRDILSVVGRRAAWTRVLVTDARVQGQGAAAEIAEGIRRLGGRTDVDVLIVGRGGGSLEDLWAFNEEAVARAIAACPVPVISAVGHEVDVTIADLVADLRAPTPSAAGEAVVPDGRVLLRQLAEVQLRLRRALQAGVDARRRRLETAPGRMARAIRSRTGPLAARVDSARHRLRRGVTGVLERRRQRVDVEDRLARGMEEQMRRARGDLRNLAGRLDALSPLGTLERGYAIPLDPRGRVLRTPGDFPSEREFDLRIAAGRVPCRVRNWDGRVYGDGQGRDRTTTLPSHSSSPRDERA